MLTAQRHYRYNEVLLYVVKLYVSLGMCRLSKHG